LVDIDFSGVDVFLSGVELEQKSFNKMVSAKYRQWVEIIFDDIVELTPQWSGNLAANWNISTDGESSSEMTIPQKAHMWPLPPYTEPFRRGDPAAVSISKARFAESIFGYSDQVYIYNPTEIAQAVEDHSIYIRGVNLLDGRVAMIAHAQAFYANFNPPL
jgi:hypothetical protein